MVLDGAHHAQGNICRVWQGASTGDEMAGFVASLLLIAPVLSAALQPSAVHPRAWSTHPAAHARAARIDAVLDPSLAADASAALMPVVHEGWAPWDAHDLAHLGPDLIHTTIYATLGLMGAYVTQVSVA
jgi:hypothetical protein